MADDHQIAVLIDFENVGPGAIQWVLDQISDIGRVIVKRAYADWNANKNLPQLMELGVEPVQVFRTTRGGKNSSDMRLVIDAIELLYQSPVDTFVIVSSDSDFVPLVRKMRAAGKTVIGAGRQATVSRALVTSCDRYFYVTDGAANGRRSQQTVQEPPKEESLLVRALRATMDAQGRAIGSRVYQAMQRMDPAFDFHTLGHSTFSRYLENSPEVKVTRPQGPGDIIVELADRPTVQSGATGHERQGPRRRRGRGRSVEQRTEQAQAAEPPAPAPPVAQPAVNEEVLQKKDTASKKALPKEPWVPVAAPVSASESAWDETIDVEWRRRASRKDNTLTGRMAANLACKVLGTANLRSSPYKTLEGLIEASPVLRGSWVREGNSVVRRTQVAP